MLGRLIKKGFSQQNSSFNILSHFKTLKTMVTTPFKHMKSMLSQDEGVYNPTWINVEAEAQDEVAHQWYALYTQNPYHLQIYNNLDNVQTVQFGTVDNPVAIFTADAPYRYVGCTGLQNEDDYEQHELMMFMLREGPMQRCPNCGQVFKLIRLRPEWTEDMDFYSSCFHPLDPSEFAIADNIQMMNILKMNTHNEPSQSEFYYADKILAPINADDHDRFYQSIKLQTNKKRLVIDPAYRLWKHKHAMDKYQVISQTFKELEDEYLSTRTQLKMPLQKRVYENVIEAERAFNILERHQRKVARFQIRELLDYENHQRREARMRKEANLRWDNHYTYFFGGLSEEEQRYRDYYQTDQEKDPEDEMIEQHIDQLQILQQKGYDPNLFDFQEYYTHNPEDDQTTVLEKKFFKFLYRAAEDPIQLYRERNQRMIARQFQRLTTDPFRQKVFQQLHEAQQTGDQISKDIAQKCFYEMAAEEGLLLYKDYYEGVPEAEIPLVEALYKMSPQKFLPIYQNFAARLSSVDGFVRIPRRDWDESAGLLENYSKDINQFIDELAPTAIRLTNQSKLDEILPLSDQTLLQLGLQQAEEKTRLQLQNQVPKK